MLLQRYQPYKFTEAINTIKDFDNMVEGLLKESYDGMVKNISNYIYAIMNQYEKK
jgi:hypothetical protein